MGPVGGGEVYGQPRTSTMSGFCRSSGHIHSGIVRCSAMPAIRPAFTSFSHRASLPSSIPRYSARRAMLCRLVIAPFTAGIFSTYISDGLYEKKWELARHCQRGGADLALSKKSDGEAGTLQEKFEKRGHYWGSMRSGDQQEQKLSW